MRSKIFFILIAIGLISSCKKDEVVAPVDTNNPVVVDSSSVMGKVELVIVPVFNGLPLYLDSTYISKANESFVLSSLTLFLSDLAVNNYKGAESVLSSQYSSGVELLDFTKANFDAGYGMQALKIDMESDTGQFSGLSFSIGVPRELNNSDPTIAPPPLDSATIKGLYWGWDSGFIFMVAEGRGLDVYGDRFHLTFGKRQGIVPFTYGGFGPPRFQVQKDKITRLTFTFDFGEVLTNQDGSGYLLSTSESANVHGGDYALIIRNNTLKAFEHIKTEIF